MNSKPLVSIIMPVYNGELYIKEAIQSVLDQTYENWELIIINDGSNDGTEKVLELFSDNRIKYSFQENSGVSTARNAALRKMKGDFFCFLDADDVFTDKSIQSRINLFIEKPDVYFVDGEVFITGTDLKDVRFVWKPSFNGNPNKELLNISERCFVTISWMFRRNKEVDYQFDEDMTHAEDLFFFIKYSRSGNYDFVNQPILYFRRTGKGAMGNLKGLENGYIKLYRKSLEYFDENGSAQMKYRIARIMGLSYLKAGNPIDAVRSFFKISFG